MAKNFCNSAVVEHPRPNAMALAEPQGRMRCLGGAFKLSTTP